MKLATFPALVFLTLAMVMFNACSTTGTSLTGEWKLISYGDVSNLNPALPDVDTSISFGADGKFGGTVGCNTFGGEYTVSGDQVTFGAVVSTLMFCEGIDAQESFVFAAVSDQKATYSINGNQLTLTFEDGKSVIVLEKK